MSVLDFIAQIAGPNGIYFKHDSMGLSAEEILQWADLKDKMP